MAFCGVYISLLNRTSSSSSCSVRTRIERDSLRIRLVQLISESAGDETKSPALPFRNTLLLVIFGMTATTVTKLEKRRSRTHVHTCMCGKREHVLWRRRQRVGAALFRYWHQESLSGPTAFICHIRAVLEAAIKPIYIQQFALLPKKSTKTVMSI